MRGPDAQERPARWLVLRTPFPGRGQELLLAEALRREGAQTLERDGARLVAYFPDPTEPEQVKRRVHALLDRTPGVSRAPPFWSWETEAERSAEWAQSARLHLVSRQLYVGPPHRSGEVPPGATFIRIRPGGAFGDAAHATTRGCLRLLAPVLQPGDRLLDVGTGSGVLAIGAALMGAGQVEAVEADPLACAAARENVTLNRVGNGVRLCCRRLTPAMLASDPRCGVPFDGILANVEPGVHRALLPSLVQVLRPHGWLVASGIPGSDLEDLLELAHTRGLELAAEERDQGWWSGRFVRPD